MNAFTAALATLHADTNLATAATFTPAAGGPIACRVILSQPQDDFAGHRSKAVEASLTVAALAGTTPAVGDTLAIGATTYRVADVQQDVLALSWTLTLGPNS